MLWYQPKSACSGSSCDTCCFCCLMCSPGRCFVRRRAQAYVGTFLRRATPAVDVEDVTGQEAETLGASVEGAGEAEDPAAGLYEVGTFCQVEMMAETEFGAQLLLQGHRRALTANANVRVMPACIGALLERNIGWVKYANMVLFAGNIMHGCVAAGEHLNDRQ